MKTSELRKRYLDYFQKKEHRLFPSDSLVPSNDPTLLFTSAGMTQFKDYFLGKRKDVKRAVSCQKCLRTGDLKNVGKTAFHHTFFEMLGNFSFGDYFKEEAIFWAWEFLTKELGFSEKDLWVSVYQDDKEAFSIWKDKVDFPKARIVKYGAKDNFWPSDALAEGPNGPCGPCSEIFFDRGKNVGCRKPDCSPACDCDRFVEMWNLVFTQFNRTGTNQVEDLPSKNIDTGMGLERVSSVLQAKADNFGIDIIEPLFKEVQSLVGNKEQSFAKAITDHLRAVTFAVSDGIYPSNEDRGYVIRRILRRALWFGFSLGQKKAFLYKLVPLTGQLNKDFYPEISGKKEVISNVILAEEERFLSTLEKGKTVLFSYIERAKKEGKKTIDPDFTFKLYDTYGFPFDLTQDIAKQNNIDIDSQAFELLLDKQRESSRKKSKFGSGVFEEGSLPVSYPTEFTGYKETQDTAVIKGIIKDDESLEEADANMAIDLVLDKSPFYPTSGGQLYDTGLIRGRSKEDFIFTVMNVERTGDTVLHRGKVMQGKIKKGAGVICLVDIQRRNSLARAHTTTHLLQASLRSILGEHVQQQGSLVDEDYLRFDFSHFQGLSEREIEQIQDKTNEYIAQGIPVTKQWLSFQEAKKKGALAFFEDKYENNVRMVEIEGISKELCAGIHLENTAQALLCVIKTESSISSGVRRIEAVTGRKAYEFLKRIHQDARRAGSILNVPVAELQANVKTVVIQNKEVKKQMDNIKRQLFEEVEAGKFLEEQTYPLSESSGLKLTVFQLKGVGPDFLRKAVDILRRKAKDKAVIIGFIQDDGKISINIGSTQDLPKAYKISCKELASGIAESLGGSGGGRDDFGFAGAKITGKITEQKITKLAIEAAGNESNKT